MGRKTIPLLLPQSLARWSLAALIAAWTVGLIALWQPPLVAAVAFATLGLRTLGGYLASHDEKDDYTSYIYYGVRLLHVMRRECRTDQDPHSFGCWEVISCLSSLESGGTLIDAMSRYGVTIGTRDKRSGTIEYSTYQLDWIKRSAPVFALQVPRWYLGQ